LLYKTAAVNVRSPLLGAPLLQDSVVTDLEGDVAYRETQGGRGGRDAPGEDVRREAGGALGTEWGATYRRWLESARDGIVVVNHGEEIVFLNLQAEKQFGYSREQLVGQKVKSIIPRGVAERLRAEGLRTAEGAWAQHMSTCIELTGRRKSGSEFPIELILSPLKSVEGVLVTAMIRDITAQRAAEWQLLQLMQTVEELKRSNEELAQFAYAASHDLLEPLRMVAKYTQLLSRRYRGKLDAEADEFIAFAVDGASRMQRLVQNLLVRSRVGAKRGDLLESSSEEALQQALINLRSAIQESGAQVTHDPLPTVKVDDIQLTQVFQNLVGNAIKYHGATIPRVHVSAARIGESGWVFSVKDDGPGIDAPSFDRIFGMFQRPHAREPFAGTGMGLLICKRIVERHGGSISVESRPGQGSTFRFTLATM
jgi:PAS domain S-box-containing protein